MKKSLKIVAVVAVIAVCCLVLAACMPSNPEKAKENLEKEGYTVITDNKIVAGALTVAGVKGIDTVVSGIKGEGDDVEAVALIYFTDKKAADEAYGKVEEYAKKSNTDDEAPVIKKSGKIIYFGTEDGIEAVK